MYVDKIEKELLCPLEYGLDIFGGRENSRIICVLVANKIMRYSSIRKEMNNITDAVLASMLNELIKDGIFDRYQYGTITPKENTP